VEGQKVVETVEGLGGSDIMVVVNQQEVGIFG